MNARELIMIQSLPLDIKIAKSKLRIEEWVRFYGEENVYISFSGGKDSTVLLHLVRSLYPNIQAVFVDTGLEYPEIKQFVKKQENVEILRPEMSFKEVIDNYGYPMISKKTSRMLKDLQNPTERNKISRMLYLSEYAIKNGKVTDKKNTQFRLAKKYKYLIDSPIKISNKCCDIMKKNPFKAYEKKTGKVPFIGTLATESDMRKANYIKTGCNAFELKHPHSTPLGFWKEQDILLYLKTHNIEIASVYGDIVQDKEGNLKTTECERTGCVYCGYGVMQEVGLNRYQLLEQTHPQLHSYCMDKLGFREVCEYMKIPYKN